MTLPHTADFQVPVGIYNVLMGLVFGTILTGSGLLIFRRYQGDLSAGHFFFLVELHVVGRIGELYIWRHYSVHIYAWKALIVVCAISILIAVAPDTQIDALATGRLASGLRVECVAGRRPAFSLPLATCVYAILWALLSEVNL